MKPKKRKPDEFEKWLMMEDKLYQDHARKSDNLNYHWVAGRYWLCSLVVQDIIREYRTFLRRKRKK